jgi:hypothetical protein
MHCLAAGVCTDACRGLPQGVCRTEFFSAGLDGWMRAVFACNQYVDEQARGHCARPIPSAWRGADDAVPCVRDLAIAMRPVVPTSADRLLDQMGIAADERDLPRLDERDWFARASSPAAFTPGAAGRRVPAPRTAGRGRRLMLIDSHCHLEYKGWSRTSRACSPGRARPGSAVSSTSRPASANGTR